MSFSLLCYDDSSKSSKPKNLKIPQTMGSFKEKFKNICIEQKGEPKGEKLNAICQNHQNFFQS